MDFKILFRAESLKALQDIAAVYVGDGKCTRGGRSAGGDVMMNTHIKLAIKPQCNELILNLTGWEWAK